MNAIKLLEAAGFEVSNRQVDANHNYMKHEAVEVNRRQASYSSCEEQRR